MIRDGADRGDGEDDKIYYFFTEVSVEYEFFSKLLIPRVARVCKVGVQQQQQPASLVPTFCSYILFSTSVFFFFTSSFVYIKYKPFPPFVSLNSAPVKPSSRQGDLGGQRTLQKKWTSFLKAKLVCSMPELNFVFNVVHDIFILKGESWRDTVIYGVFTSQWSVSVFFFYY